MESNVGTTGAGQMLRLVWSLGPLKSFRDLVHQAGLKSQAAGTSLESGDMGACPMLGFTGMGPVLGCKANSSAYTLLLFPSGRVFFPHWYLGWQEGRYE